LEINSLYFEKAKPNIKNGSQIILEAQHDVVEIKNLTYIEKSFLHHKKCKKNRKSK
jgi:hypothetical protein